jgi:hypothetical protein
VSFQTPISISDAITRIRERRLLLPAIQREFVWESAKVEWLFDSLLQGYPFGSFLFWEVRDEHAKAQYRYYEFIREYRERYKTHNPEFNTHGHIDFSAVLDGQQRLTSLYIGLAGTFAYKSPRVWWENDEYALPTRTLYLEVSGPAADNEDQEPGRQYNFRFLTNAEYGGNAGRWFKVGDILSVSSAFDFNKMMKERGYQDSEFASQALSELHAAVHTHRLINYYLIQQSDMERALNVFVRINSGGEPLSLSDMLMSTAIANWTTKDARKEIPNLVDQIQTKGFFITKDLIMKACLYLYSSDIRYRVSNFSAAHVKPFEDNWDAINQSILAVFELARDFGFNEKSLTSKNALLPIAYWIHHMGLQHDIRGKVALKPERDKIRKWLHVMLLKGIFGGGSGDTTLAAMRRAFTDAEFGNPYIRPDLDSFPASAIGDILRAQGKDPVITDDFVNSLLATQKDDRTAFSLLAILSPNLDYKNGNFHADHLHPESAFRHQALVQAGIPASELDFYKNKVYWNSILNLQHLDSNENVTKQATPLADWVQAEANRQNISTSKFCLDHNLPPDNAKLELKALQDFIAFRRERLKELLYAALN